MAVGADADQHQLEPDRAGTTADVLELALVFERALLVSALAEDPATELDLHARLLERLEQRLLAPS